MRLMTSSGRIPEIGVFVEGGAAAGLAAVLGVTQPALGPLIGENGVQIKMRMYDRTKLRWIMPMGDSTRAAPGRPPRIPPPPRYQVRVLCFRTQKSEGLMTTALNALRNFMNSWPNA